MSKIYQTKGQTFAAQYYDAGALMSKSIRVAVKKIEHSRLKMTKIRRMLAERALAQLREQPSVQEFIACLTSWADGAGISVEQAMWLMADNLSGCQTLIVKYKSGIALLHTEEEFEDPVARMKGEKTMVFSKDGRLLKALVYNNLMPGAGVYGWQKDMIVAVDSLFLREDGIEKIERPLLANIVAWMVWQMDPVEAAAEQIVKGMKALGTVIDGYAINVVRRTGAKIEGYKLTFARDDYEIERVWEQPGDHLRQVNIIEPRYARQKKAVAVWRHSPWKMYVDYRGFINRLSDIKLHVQMYKKWLLIPLEQTKIEEVHRGIHKILFTDLRSKYVNEWLGAVCVGLVDQTGMSVSMKINDNQPGDHVEYIDVI